MNHERTTTMGNLRQRYTDEEWDRIGEPSRSATDSVLLERKEQLRMMRRTHMNALYKKVEELEKQNPEIQENTAKMLDIFKEVDRLKKEYEALKAAKEELSKAIFIEQYKQNPFEYEEELYSIEDGTF